LWALMQSTSVKKSYCSICTQVTLVCITRTIFKLSPLWLTQLGFQEIHVLTSQTARVADQLRGLTSFVFGFYLIGRIGWWWDVMACGKAVQASIHDIAMLVGAIVHEEGDEWLELKFDLFRYLCCLFVFSFPRTDNKMALLTDDMLMELGFLKEKEVELLRSSFYPRQMIVKWTTCWSSKYIHNVMERQLVMQKVSELRDNSNRLQMTVGMRPPWTFEALLYATIRLWIVIITFSDAVASDDRGLALILPIGIPLVSFTLFTSFYQVILHMLDSFNAPFGQHMDALNVETLFLETETTVWEYLTSPHPPKGDGIKESARGRFARAASALKISGKSRSKSEAHSEHSVT